MTKNIHIVCFSALCRLYAVFALALMLCACDWDNNFFYQPVDFRGEAEEPQLVVNAILEADCTPVIYVNRSVFFLDTTAYEMVEHEERYEGDSTLYTYVTNDLRRDYVKDATVEMRIDDGPWTKLTCQQMIDSLRYTNPGTAFRTEVSWAYVSDIMLRPGNRVEVRIAHNDYPKGASVTTVIPLRAGASIEDVDFSVERKPYWLPIKIILPPYQGNPTDVLSIRARSLYYRIDSIHTYLGLDPLTGDSLWQHEETDRTPMDDYWSRWVYSRDIGFARFDNINQSLSDNHYGSNCSIGLYHDVNLTDAPITIEVEVPYFDPEYYRSLFYESMSAYHTMYAGADTILVEVVTVNRDAYFYLSSMMQAGYISNYVSDPWYDSSENPSFDLSDILDEIQDAFSEMGSMEGVQIYGNVKGAFGQVGARTVERIVINCR